LSGVAVTHYCVFLTTFFSSKESGEIGAFLILIAGFAFIPTTISSTASLPMSIAFSIFLPSAGLPIS